jgi:hypothetical protein
MTIPVTSGGGPIEKPIPSAPKAQTKFAVKATKPKASDIEAVAGDPITKNPACIKKGLHASGIYGNVRTYKENSRAEGQRVSGRVSFMITVGKDGSVTDVSANLDISCQPLDQQIASLELKGKHRSKAENKQLATLKKQKAAIAKEVTDTGAKGIWGLKFEPPGKGGSFKINAPYKF